MIQNISYPWRSKRAFLGALVVAIGVMLLLDTSDALGKDTSIFGTYWPAILIVWGAWRIASRGFRISLGSVILLTLGIGFLLAELGSGSWGFGRLWPVILVFIGLSIILRRGRRYNYRWRNLTNNFQ